MVDNINKVVDMAVIKLKEIYGDNFGLEDGDEFIFTLNNGVLILSKEDLKVKVKVALDAAIPLDMEFSF